MAYEHIKITASAGPHASELNNAVTQLEAARDTFRRLKEQMEAMIDGVDYTRIETLFGLEAGNGQTVYNLVAGTVSTFTDDADLVQTIKRLG